MIKFYGQNFQDQFIFEKYFPNKTNGISIECGAFDGITESATYFFRKNKDWVSICIEASPPNYEKLIARSPDSININKGLSNKKEKLIFKHVIHPNHGDEFGNGSFNHKQNHRNELINNKCSFEEYEVETTTYTELIDDLMQKNFPNKEIDLFVLDVEGLELEVIDGMVGSKYLPKIMSVEYPHVGIENLNSVLKNLGYLFDSIKDNNAYYIKNDSNL